MIEISIYTVKHNAMNYLNILTSTTDLFSISSQIVVIKEL